MAKIINIIGQKFGKLTVINMRSDRGNSNQIRLEHFTLEGYQSEEALPVEMLTRDK